MGAWSAHGSQGLTPCKALLRYPPPPPTPTDLDKEAAGRTGKTHTGLGDWKGQISELLLAVTLTLGM